MTAPSPPETAAETAAKTAAQTRAAGRPLDASMTLLREVMERPLDPGYAAAAAAPRRASRAGAALTLVLAVLAGGAFSVSVTSIRQPQRQSAAADAQLRGQIEQATTSVDVQEVRNAALTQEIALARRNALGAAGRQLADRTEILGLAAGEVPVAGPGLTFTVDDADAASEAVGGDPRADEAFSDGTVLDADLQVIVNGLWAAGAEAISINGERLTALSAIRSAGQAILVDFRPLVPPYVLHAIGDPSGLQAGFASGSAGPYVQSMRDNSGIRVDIEQDGKLTLPGASQLALRSARPVGEQP